MLHAMFITDTVVGMAALQRQDAQLDLGRPTLKRQNGGKLNFGSVEIGLTRDAKIKKAVKEVRTAGENAEDDAETIEAAVLKKQIELEGKKEEDLNKILQVDF